MKNRQQVVYTRTTRICRTYVSYPRREVYLKKSKESILRKR